MLPHAIEGLEEVEEWDNALPRDIECLVEGEEGDNVEERPDNDASDKEGPSSVVDLEKVKGIVQKAKSAQVALSYYEQDVANDAFSVAYDKPLSLNAYIRLQVLFALCHSPIPDRILASRTIADLGRMDELHSWFSLQATVVEKECFIGLLYHRKMQKTGDVICNIGKDLWDMAIEMRSHDFPGFKESHWLEAVCSLVRPEQRTAGVGERELLETKMADLLPLLKGRTMNLMVSKDIMILSILMKTLRIQVGRMQ